MKKKSIFALAGTAFIAVLALATVLNATQFTPFDGSDGSFILKNRQGVVLTRYAGNVGGVMENYPAAVTVYAGEPVVLVADAYVTRTANTYAIAISKVASAGSLTVIGVVALPAGVTVSAAGTTVDICTRGIALVKCGVNVTIGDILIQSATAGLLTAAAASSGTVMLDISRTSAVAMAVETKTSMAVGGTLVRARIIAP